MRFKDKVVLVTGAVRNTGLSIAEAFAKEGATVALNSRNVDDVVREAARLRERFGITVVEVPADVAVGAEVDAMFKKIESECGRLDVLVNNAILQGCGYSFVDTPRDLLESVFAVNVFGAFACGQGAAGMMIKAGRGSIINIGSNVAKRAIHDRAAYIASKGAIDSLTRAMAIDLASNGIRVNSVVAGYIHSDRWQALTTETDRRRLNIPLGHEATGADIADSILFMASDASSKITGACLTVDGGMTAQLAPIDCDV